MKKYQEKINELGGFDKLSKNLKKMVKEYEDALGSIDQMKADLEGVESEEERQALQTEIEETEALLPDAHAEIMRKIESYIKNKDGYEERMKAMRDKKDAALAAQGKPPVQYKQKPEAAPAPAAQAAPAAPAKVEETPAGQGEAVITKSGGGATQVITPEVIEEKEEKGFGSWLLLGALGVAGIFIGVNLFKNRN